MQELQPPLKKREILLNLLRSDKLIPWRLVHDWVCQACGECCKHYIVELTPHEYAKIVQTYGYSPVTVSLGKMYLKRRADGSCFFLHEVGGRNLCGLQPIKPKACKLWPFQVFEHPSFGYPELSSYRYGRREFHVYVVPRCKGLYYGEPSHRLKKKVIPEILEIWLGLKVNQKYSTSSKLMVSTPLILRV